MSTRATTAALASVLLSLAVSTAALARPAQRKPHQTSDAVREVIDRVNQLNDATVKHDSPALEDILHPDFLYTSSDANPVDRATFISEAQSDVLQVELIKLHGLRVRVYGAEAIVTGLLTAEFKYDKQSVNRIFDAPDTSHSSSDQSAGEVQLSARGRIQARCTDVYIKREDRWQLVAMHMVYIGDRRPNRARPRSDRLTSAVADGFDLWR